MARVIGVHFHTARLRRMRVKTAPLVTKALYAAGQMIEIDAEISITTGSISGKNHVPSLPGEPPNADTRLLDTSIETSVVKEGLVHVTSNAPYSEALEFGTSKMAERPFMRPAAKKNRKAATELVKRAVAKSTT